MKFCETRALPSTFREKCKGKRCRREPIWSLFLLETPKTTFWMANLTIKWIKSLPFFQNQSMFFYFLLSPVSVDEYASIFLNISKHSLKWLNKLFWLCQDSEYTWSSYLFNKLLKIPRFLNMPEFWIWHGCICQCYTEFWICLNMAQYVSIIPECPLTSSLIRLKIFECLIESQKIPE